MAKGRKTGGRTKGTPNKATADIKALASVHGAEAISTLERLMREGENEQICLAACRELLDRGYGRARQAMDINDNRVNVVIADEFSYEHAEAERLGESTFDSSRPPVQPH